MKTLPTPVTLFDEARGKPLPLPSRIGRWYGPLRFLRPAGRPLVVANFVSTLDGVVAFEEPHGGGREISGGSVVDRMLMGLLRAAADAVVVGAGTLRSVPRHRWTAEHLFPGLRREYASVRRGLRIPPVPTNVFVTANGGVDLGLPVFRTPGLPCLIVTTVRGARVLRRQEIPPRVEIATTGGEKRVPARSVVRILRDRIPQARLILLEGGPHLLGDFLSESLIDELFLTLAPQVAGRTPGLGRLGLVEGKTFGPREPLWGSLRSVRRAGDHLLLRYALPKGGRREAT